MSTSARTQPRLRLVRPPGDPQPVGEDRLLLRPSPRLREFVAAAAEAGLEPEEALRLAVERALALSDACAFGLDPGAARALLQQTARAARPTRPLPPAHAARVRGLGNPEPLPPVDTTDGLAVPLPEGLLVRARDGVPESALDPAGVPEMVAWELAATLSGRTMGEWALRALAGRRAVAA